jgi:hypothetical protein
MTHGLVKLFRNGGRDEEDDPVTDAPSFGGL